MSIAATQQPSPKLFLETVNAYQRTEALKAAIELEVFTAIGEGKTSYSEIARGCQTSERGMRILCDFLSMIGFLTKDGQRYSLTPDTATFLDKKSPAYIGGAMEFMLSPMLIDGFKDLSEIVRKGSTLSPEGGSVAPNNPVWIKFARAMAPMMALPAQSLAAFADPHCDKKLKILDIAAGHGLYGIAFAQRNPAAEVVALDWPSVLEIAKENAVKSGVDKRFQTIEGNAFDAQFGNAYDLVLLTNFLHHFDPDTCEVLLQKVRSALKYGGRVATVEFVPNEDRISPPDAAGFSLMMLASTPSGDAYTFSELDQMFKNAGFSRSEIHPLPPGIQQVVISEK